MAPCYIIRQCYITRLEGLGCLQQASQAVAKALYPGLAIVLDGIRRERQTSGHQLQPQLQPGHTEYTLSHRSE